MNPSKNTSQLLSLRIQPWDLVVATGAILSIATVFGFLGDFWWFLDLFSHFRVQYLSGLLVVALVLLFRRRYRMPTLFALFAVVNFCTIAPLYFGKEPQPDEGLRSYRALLMNVNSQTGIPDKVTDAIRELNPDIILLEEVNDQWLSALSGVLKAYPYSRVEPRDDNFGIALLSKHPLIQGHIQEVGEAGVPTVVAELDLPDARLTVIATHPVPPGSREYTRLRNDQLERLPEVVKQASSPVLLLGDLNATPWCHEFQRLLARSGLRDSSQGRGVLGTWPTSLPILLIPLDQCLYSAGVHVTGKAIGPKVGSDHYPLVVDFAVVGKLEAGRK
jgi:endonuclease/exonuclease/phosphatase (EEP) superfamily protein YafD